jgi:hypothetical protein
MILAYEFVFFLNPSRSISLLEHVEQKINKKLTFPVAFLYRETALSMTSITLRVESTLEFPGVLEHGTMTLTSSKQIVTFIL